jgi:predicted RNase H-like HicB family nuclease
MLNAEERGPNTERRTEKGIENRGRRSDGRRSEASGSRGFGSHLRWNAKSLGPCILTVGHSRLPTVTMTQQFTLEYWKHDGWYVGRLKEMPSIMSQGETLEELQSMIGDSYKLIVHQADGDAFVNDGRQDLAISL